MNVVDPEASWSAVNNIEPNEINRSGLIFPVEYMGFTPVLSSLRSIDAQARSIVLRNCMKTIIDHQETESYKKFVERNKVGNFVRLDSLKTEVIITSSTITMFYTYKKRKRIISRYRTSFISHFMFETFNDEIYFGYVASLPDKRDCNVIKLFCASQKEHMLTLLQNIDNIDQFVAFHIDSRLKSAQNFKLEKYMSPFYHGNIDPDNCYRYLEDDGDFLFRESRRNTGIVVTYKKGSLIESSSQNFTVEEMFSILSTYRDGHIDILKKPIPRIRY